MEIDIVCIFCSLLLAAKCIGKSGFVQFGENRQRELAIAVFTLHECATGYEYKRLYGSQPLAQPNLTRILWPGNATSPPLDSPPCGWDNEYCTVPVGQCQQTQ